MINDHVVVGYLPGSGGQILGWAVRQCIDSSVPTIDPQDLRHGHCHYYKSYFGCRITEATGHRYGYWNRQHGIHYPVPPPQHQQGGAWPAWSSQFTRGRIRVLPSHRAYRPGELPQAVSEIRIVVSEGDLDLVFELYRMKMGLSITRSQWLAHIAQDLRLAQGRGVPNHLFCLDRDLAILGIDPQCWQVQFRSLLDPRSYSKLDSNLISWARGPELLARARSSLDLWRAQNHVLIADHCPDLWAQWLNIQ